MRLAQGLLSVMVFANVSAAGTEDLPEIKKRGVLRVIQEVFPNRSIAVSWRPHAAVHTLEQLRRERVGTMRDSAWSDRLESARVPAANVDDSYETPEQVLEALRAGKVAAVAMPVDRALVENRRSPELQLGVFLPPSPGRAWALRKEARPFCTPSTSTSPTSAGRPPGTGWS